MPKVLILGAGASNGHGYGTEKLNRPPVLNGFFRHPLFDDLRSDYSSLVSYLKKSLGINKDELQQTDVEALIGQLEPLWELKIRERAENKSVLEFDKKFEIVTPFDLLRAYIVDIIFLSTNWLESAECPYHSRIVKNWLTEKDIIVSFNYDLIIDKSLLKHTDWTESNGYGWNAKDRPNPIKDSKFYGIKKKYVPAKIQLLKLHGSINFSHCWREEIVNEFPSVELINSNQVEEVKHIKSIAVSTIDKFYREFQPKYLPSLLKRYLKGDKSEKYTLQILAKSWCDIDLVDLSLLPQLIFPTPYKQFNKMSVAEMSGMWKQAFQALQNADEILSCGFSFRDKYFNQIIQESLRQRNKPLNFKIVDPSKEAISDISKRLTNCNLKIIPIVNDLRDYSETLC